MRAILISPDSKTVSVVADFSGDFRGARGAYELLTSPAKTVDTIDMRDLGGGVTLLFDDEGGLVDGNPVFRLTNGLVIAGRALMVGDARALNAQQTEEQDFCDLPTVCAVEGVTRLVTFTDKVTTGEFGEGRAMTEDELPAHLKGMGFSGWKGGEMILRDVT